MADNDSLQQLMKMLGIGGGLGASGMGAWGLTHPGKNPATGAMNTIGGIPGKVNPYYQPYADNGKNAMNTLNQQNQGLLGGTTQDMLGAGYKESPGYKYALNQAMGAGNNAAAAGGSLGTPMHQEANMDVAQGLASKDYNDYMQRQMGLYGLGYGGTENMNKMGYDANNSMADWTGNSEAQKGALQYEGDKGQNQAKSDLWKQILSGLGTAGGAAVGGPAGGMAGGGIAELLKHLFGG